jgi:hypothetical protein
MAEFVKLNFPRWEYFDCRDQLPGQENAGGRKKSVSVLPGTNAAKNPVPEPTAEERIANAQWQAGLEAAGKWQEKLKDIKDLTEKERAELDNDFGWA